MAWLGGRFAPEVGIVVARSHSRVFVAIVATGAAVGGAAVVAGGVIYALGMREKSDRDRQVAIQPARDGEMMVWGGSF